MTKIAEFANSVDLDEVAHSEVAQNELPHLDIHCCPLLFEFSICTSLDLNFFKKFADVSFVIYFLVVKELRQYKTISYQCQCNISISVWRTSL